MPTEERYLDKNLYIFGQIDAEMAEGICTTLIALEALGAPEVNIWLNTPGGEMAAAFAITDIFHAIKCKVRVIALGECYSAGMNILVNGTPGMRLVMPNASLMMHEFGWAVEGRSSNIIATNIEVVNLHDKLQKMFVKYTNMTKKTIDLYLKGSDTWLTPKEAVELGIADKIITGSIANIIKVG